MGETNTPLLNALLKKVGSSTREKKENELCVPTQGNRSMKVPRTAGVCVIDVENQTLGRSSPLGDSVLSLVTSACRRHVPQGSIPQGRGWWGGGQLFLAVALNSPSSPQLVPSCHMLLTSGTAPHSPCLQVAPLLTAPHMRHRL